MTARIVLTISIVLLIAVIQALQPPPVRKQNGGARGLHGAMLRRYARATPTVLLTKCGDSSAGSQNFTVDTVSQSLKLADGRCLIRDPESPGGLTAGICDGTASSAWTAGTCTAVGCSAGDIWVQSNEDKTVAGCPGAIGPTIEMWEVDNPTGSCKNELWKWIPDNAAATGTLSNGQLHSQNINNVAGCPTGPDVTNFCLTIIPPPPPPPPCTTSPRVGCHVGIWESPPTRTPSNGVIDGPLLGNGDLGGALAASSNGGFEMWLGKADMWATNTATVNPAFPSLHSDTFYTIVSAGRIAIQSSSRTRISSSSSSFSALQKLATATVEANASGVISMNAIIASDENSLLMRITVTASARYNVSLGVDTAYGLPLNAGTDNSGSGSLWVSKAGVTAKDNSMILMPCDTKTYVIWPSINTFSKDATTGRISLLNGTQSPLCPRRVWLDSNPIISIGSCDDGEGAWQLSTSPLGGQIRMIANNSLCAWAVLPAYHNSGGIIKIGECAQQTSMFWTFAEGGGGQISVNSTQCLTAVPPNVNITLGLTARIFQSDTGAAIPFAVSSINKDTSVTAAEVTAGFDLTAGIEYLLVVGAASTRDVNWSKDPVDASNAIASAYAGMAGVNYAAARVAAHAASWATFWNVSEVQLDDSRGLLEGFWYGAQYILGCNARAGAIPAGLWGVWAVSDTNGWNGDFTLDYNAQANYYGACSSNHCELVRPHLDTVASDWHLEVSRQRAAANWNAKGSAGGPGQTSQSQCCGYMDEAYENPHVCPQSAAGNYDGLEMTTHIGPFAGLIYFSDLSLRVVGSMSMMPFIEYVDFSSDDVYLNVTAYAIVSAVGDFLLSYATFNTTDGYSHFLNTCAQEICSGGPESEDDAHHDLAFTRTVLSTLIRWSIKLNRDIDKRAKWVYLKETLPPYSIGTSNSGASVWLEARNTQSYFGSNSAGYPIVYTAALHPAGDVSLSASPEMLETACNTVFAVANVSHFHPLNGLCMAWPPAARGCGGIKFAKTILDGWESALSATMGNNFYPDLDGGGIEQAGATEGINSALLQSQEGFIRLFPMIPIGETASFKTLRARGAFLVTAKWQNGTILSPVIIDSASTLIRNCSFLWVGVPNVVDASNVTVTVSKDTNAVAPDVWIFETLPNSRYFIL